MRAKYGNHKLTIKGETYDSQIELARHLFLQNREKEGAISNLRRQVDYELIPAQYGTRIKHLKTKDKEETYLIEKSCHYKADFVYERNGKLVVEDCKGQSSPKFSTQTPEFRIKKKLMLWRYGIKVEIITSPTCWEENYSMEKTK